MRYNITYTRYNRLACYCLAILWFSTLRKDNLNRILFFGDKWGYLITVMALYQLADSWTDQNKVLLKDFTAPTRSKKAWSVYARCREHDDCPRRYNFIMPEGSPSLQISRRNECNEVLTSHPIYGMYNPIEITSFN